MMKNKRGEISIVILVIGIFAVCSLALITFFISSVKFKESFGGIDLMEKINLQIENKTFYNENVEGLYLEKKIEEREKWYSLEKKEKILFSVKYHLP